MIDILFTKQGAKGYSITITNWRCCLR